MKRPIKKNKLFWAFMIPTFFVLSVSDVYAQVSFDPARNFDSGDGVNFIVSQDFNGDGLVDIATSNKKTDTVSVHLNGGGGVFLTPWNEYHVGPFSAPTPVDKQPKSLPMGVASADFDGDGDQDLVVSNSDADTVSVLLNFGDGTFLPAADFTVRTDGIAPNPGNPENYHILHPESVTTCDINGDTFVDIVAANMGGARVSVLLGNGLGSFGLPTQTFVGGQPISVVCDDFDKNGAEDIVTVNNSAIAVPVPGTPWSTPTWYVSVLSNLGDGSIFTQVQYEVGANPVQVIAVDLDNNGWLDLLTANHSGTGSVSTLMNSAAGFVPKTEIPTHWSPNSVAVGDFDQNGRLDLVTPDHGTGGGVSIMLQNLDGTFEPYRVFSTGALNAPSFVIADTFTDLSLDVDILAHANTSDTFSLLQNQLTVNPLPPTGLPPVGGVPDLTANIDKLKSEYRNGATKFEIQILVNNIGGGAAEGWFRVTASLGGALLEQWDLFSGLQARTNQVLKYKAPLPISGSISGQVLTITVDSDHYIPESDETNNVITQTMN